MLFSLQWFLIFKVLIEYCYGNGDGYLDSVTVFYRKREQYTKINYITAFK